ncbi:MAG: DUF1580 domain-containing protein [Pirellulales bacterium]
MIDVNNEHLVPLAEVPLLLPASRSGRPVHLSAIYRWAMKGLKGIRLETLQCAGRRVTSREALSRFFAALSEQAGLTEPSTQARTRSPVARKRSHEMATANLEAKNW